MSSNYVRITKKDGMVLFGIGDLSMEICLKAVSVCSSGGHFGIESDEIKNMEISHSLLFPLQDILQKVPFDVTCPENDLRNKQIDDLEISSGEQE